MKKFRKANKNIDRITQLKTASDSIFNIFKETSKSLETVNVEIVMEVESKNNKIASLQKENEELNQMLSENLTLKAKIDAFLGQTPDASAETTV